MLWVIKRFLPERVARRLRAELPALAPEWRRQQGLGSDPAYPLPQQGSGIADLGKKESALKAGGKLALWKGLAPIIILLDYRGGVGL